MKKLTFLITVFLFGITYCYAQNNGLATIDFFIGQWEMETIDIQPDGTFVKGKAKSIVKYILDGNAMQDDFMTIGESGEILFWGTSIRSYNPRTDKFQIVWIMPGYRGLTDIVAEWKEDKLISTGKGYDYAGEFLERFEYYDIKKNSYSFKMDRSYDGGETWIENFGRMKAKRIKND